MILGAFDTTLGRRPYMIGGFVMFVLLLAWSGKQKREDEVKREMRRQEVKEEARRRRQQT